MELVIRGIVPLSYNSKDAKRKAAYCQKIRSAFLRKYSGHVPQYPASEELYARVYFFSSDGVSVDCDNISKPIWDSVNNLVYSDDRQIVMRTATVIDVKKHPYSYIDASEIDGDVAAELMQGLTDPDVKCLYIECGTFKEEMIKLGDY